MQSVQFMLRSNNTNKFNPQERPGASFGRPLVQIIQINSILKNLLLVYSQEQLVQIIQINSILKNSNTTDLYLI